MIDLKIISDGTCLRRSPALSPITSDRTFCATGAKDEGPCPGDSGGGLIIFKENKWFLRGLVSASESPKDVKCAPGSIVIFTDVSKFVSWIPSHESVIKPHIELKPSSVNNGMSITRGQFPW